MGTKGGWFEWRRLTGDGAEAVKLTAVDNVAAGGSVVEEFTPRGRATGRMVIGGSPDGVGGKFRREVGKTTGMGTGSGADRVVAS